MHLFRFSFLLLFIGSCHSRPSEPARALGAEGISWKENKLSVNEYDERAGKGALLLTRFTSLADFKTVVQVQYAEDLTEESGETHSTPEVRLTYHSAGREVISILKSGISQADFWAVRNGSIWDKAWLGLKCPFAFLHRIDLGRIENLGRRRPWLFGKGDVAFYDLAETMVNHIVEADRVHMPAADLSEKGYLNTFNHITAQAFMTSVFSDEVADFVADVHELYNMPDLVTGNFTEKELSDFENGPVDNYVDMINNEWGQDLGKELGKKYTLNRTTYWTPELLTSYLNDIQTYYSWAFQIGFEPFRPGDEIITRFAAKINSRQNMATKT